MAVNSHAILAHQHHLPSTHTRHDMSNDSTCAEFGLTQHSWIANASWKRLRTRDILCPER
jgi:hypothetical protein